jgi:hypothetical protein
VEALQQLAVGLLVAGLLQGGERLPAALYAPQKPVCGPRSRALTLPEAASGLLPGPAGPCRQLRTAQPAKPTARATQKVMGDDTLRA